MTYNTRMHMKKENSANWRSYGTEYLTWYQRLNGCQGEAFDPAPFARLARDQWQDEPALSQAWLKCTMQWPESALYTHFMPPHQHAQRWKFRSSHFLQHPTLGTLVVDVLKDGSIGGMEYLDRACTRHADAGKHQAFRIKHATRERSRKDRN